MCTGWWLVLNNGERVGEENMLAIRDDDAGEVLGMVLLTLISLLCSCGRALH